MIDRRRWGLGVVAFTSALLGALLSVGCSNDAQAPAGGSGGPPPGAGQPPGGPGGGPPGMGGQGGAVAETASASEIYQQRCQNCHGSQGQGGTGPVLTGIGGRPDAEIRKIIHDGHEQMPAFGNQMTAAQLDQLVAHVKKLGSGS